MSSHGGQRRGPKAALLATLLLSGCAGIGADQLSRDEIEFSRALAISDNQQTLLNIVRLRYAEAPTFLELTQVISGYQAQQVISGSLNLFPTNHTSNYFGGSGSLQLQESPTFTYAPVTGEQFAETFLRPLPPATILPLVLTGLPIDLLLRMVVQSINGANNVEVLSDSAKSVVGHDFARLVEGLRVLQVAGLLDIQFAQPIDQRGKPRQAAHPATVAEMGIRSSDDVELAQVTAQVRRMLGLPNDDEPFDIVFGRRPTHPREVAIVTRSLLSVLGSMAFGIDVPAADVDSGRTMPDIVAASPIKIHSGRYAPDDAFVAIEYDNQSYWISSKDFRSKLAFALLQNLLALAQTKQPPGAIVTIPAG